MIFPLLVRSFQVQSIFSTNIFSASTCYLLITLIGDKDTKMNKTLPVLKELTVISGRLEYRLKLAIACSMCSKEVCAECHVNAEEEQLSLRPRKGFIGDGEEKGIPRPFVQYMQSQVGQENGMLGEEGNM